MQDRTSRFGSGMHDWLSNFGSRFKAGWKSLSRGVRNIFGDMWDAMKRLGKNAMGGLIDIVNAGISGIKKTVTLPSYLNELGKEKGINFSALLVNALKNELQVD